MLVFGTSHDGFRGESHCTGYTPSMSRSKDKYLFPHNDKCTWCKVSYTLQYSTSHQVSNNWFASEIIIVTRVVVNFNHLIYNAHNLFSAALIKDLVRSPITWALPPKRFRIPSVCDPSIPWWHHAQCGSLQHMVRSTSTLACL